MKIQGVVWKIGDLRSLAPRRTITLTTMVMTLAGLPVFLTGSLATMIRASLGFDVSDLGLVVTTFFAFSAVFSSLAGRLIQQRGAEFGLRLALIGSGVSLGGIGLAATSLTSLAGCLAIGGAANAAAQASTTLLLVNGLNPRGQGLGFGIRQSSSAFGMILGGLALPIVAVTSQWKWVYLSLAATGFILASRIPACAVQKSHAAPSKAKARLDTDLFPLIVLAMATSLGGATITSLGTFFVASSVSVGMPPATAGLLMATSSAVGLCVRVVVGLIADRRTRGRLVGVALMLLVGGLGHALLGSQRLDMIIYGALLAFGLGGGWSGLFNLAVVVINPTAPALATGITQTGAYVGTAVGPFLFGSLVAQLSYAAAWRTTAGMLGLASVLALIGRNRVRRSLENRRVLGGWR